MNNQHLTDIEIQEFLFQESDPDKNFSKHLQQCTACKVRTDQYREIFESVRKENKPVFDFDLAELVIKRLPSVKADLSSVKLLIILILSIALPIGGALIYLFYTRFSVFLIGLTPFFVYLIATGMTGLVIFQAIDIYLRYKRKMMALDIY